MPFNGPFQSKLFYDSTRLDCTSRHTTHHEDYSRGVATEQHGKGPQSVNVVRSCLTYSCQGSPLKTETATMKSLD